MTRTSNRRVSIGALGMIAACVTLAACGSPGPQPVEVGEPLELRTYEVPPEYQEDLRTMLRSALESEDNRVGRVTKGPGGTLLVVAPSRIQAGVEQILSKGFEAPPVPSPVKLTYWLLVSRPRSASTEDRPGLPQLEPVLRQIEAAQGPSEFSLLEQLQLTSMSQTRARTTGTSARIMQRATRRGEQIVADVEISLGDNSFQSQVMLERGRFLVLGQAGFGGRPGHAFPDAGNDESLILYYVMAADLEP